MFETKRFYNMKLGRLRHKGFRFELMYRCEQEILQRFVEEMRGMKNKLMLTADEIKGGLTYERRMESILSHSYVSSSLEPVEEEKEEGHGHEHGGDDGHGHGHGHDHDHHHD